MKRVESTAQQRAADLLDDGCIEGMRVCLLMEDAADELGVRFELKVVKRAWATLKVRVKKRVAGVP
jgi:hypothetical protein